MRGVSTFGAFTTARLGIYAAQKALDVTGHNITNINTRGYTRQRLDQMSLFVGGPDGYASSYDSRVGSGVLTTGVSQLRDPYLDIRYRNELSSVGSMDAKLSGLDDISKFLDEVGKGKGSGVLEKQFNDLIQQLQGMTTNAGNNVNDSLVRSSADSLAKLFQHYSTQLGTVKENQVTSFKQDLDTVNNLLKNIGSLNDKIFKSELHGDGALELKDERNLMIDELSKFVKIDVTYESTSVGAGATVDKMIIKLAGSPGTGTRSSATLVDGAFATQFGITQRPTLNPNPTAPANPGAYLKPDGTATDVEADALMYADPDYHLSLKSLADDTGTTLAGSNPVNLTDQALYGSLQASREFLTKEGEFSTAGDISNDLNATSKRGLPYYEKSLNALANRLADTLNDANTVYKTDADGNYLDATTGTIIEYDPLDNGNLVHLTNDVSLTDELRSLLKAKGDLVQGGPLFSKNSQTDDPTGIDASNISISKSWSTGEVRIVNSITAPGTAANDNILNMILLMTGKHDFTPQDGAADASGTKTFFRGSFQEMFTNMSATLANDVKSTSTLLNNYASSATEIDISRSAVSGVDLNDEATNLMQFQKSYSAACRLMTTLDEALDKLINSTGVVGR